MQMLSKSISIWRLACGILTLASTACVYAPQEEAYSPPPHPHDILSESAAAIRTVRSMKFELSHQRGSMYFVDDTGSHIKATDVAGEWDDVAGLALDIDAYLVRDRHVDPTSGTYFPLQMVLLRDGLYITDPLSGQWVVQPPELAIIPVWALNDVISELVSLIESPKLEQSERIDGRETYKISGSISGSAADWLTQDSSERPRVDIIIWIDSKDHIPRKVHLIGPIGWYDEPGAMRQLLLSDFNQEVRITPPEVFIDLR